MRAAFIAVSLVSACVGAFVACSDETATSPGATDGGGGAEGGTSGDGAPRPSDAGTDAPISPTGCPLATTGYRSGAKAENIPRTDIAGGVSWTDVEGALSEDGKLATVTLDDGQESAELRVSQFGIKLPDTAETWGIEVQLKRRAPDGGVEDSRVDLAIEGKAVAWKYVKGPWPTKIVGTHHYGQAIDTWGVDLYPSDVNRDSFAAKLWVKKSADAGPGPVTATVDSLKVAVWYCPK